MATNCGPVMLLASSVSFKIKVMFLLKMMLISDELLLSGHLSVPRGWPLNAGSTVFQFRNGLLHFQGWKIAGQISRLFQEFKTLYEPWQNVSPQPGWGGAGRGGAGRGGYLVQ